MEIIWIVCQDLCCYVLNHILLEWILKQEMKHVKKFVISLLNKMKIGAKTKLSFFMSLFSREQEIEVWKKCVSERIFCSRTAF